MYQCAANTPLNAGPGSSASELWYDANDRAACWRQNAVLFTTLATEGTDKKTIVEQKTNKSRSKVDSEEKVDDNAPETQIEEPSREKSKRN